ncbi:MAG: HDOD domain-containing protein [Chloroflexi bacterium]|nr:HDOD domain-containing protein [Chloroflexota bacterium]
MRRILFVDDDPAALARIRETVQQRRPDWEIEFAASGTKAWEKIVHTPFDVVVTDWDMPGMDGAELLFKVMHRNPQTVRIALSDQADRETLLESLGPAHQHLSKWGDIEALIGTITRATTLRDVLANERLQGLVSHVLALPSMPDLYLELLEELRQEEPSVQRIGQIISRDLGMSAKILQFVNSAFQGRTHPAGGMEEAVTFLGIETIKALVLSLQIFSLYSHASIEGFSFSELWTHSWTTGVLARRIAEAENFPAREADQAFLAGLLHDVGKLVLATGMPVQYQTALALRAERQSTLCEAEQTLFGCSHAEVGAYLLGLWGLPVPIVEAVAFHHVPAQSQNQGFDLVIAVHVANGLQHEKEKAGSAQSSSALDLDLLVCLGLQDRLPIWKEKASV